MKKFAWYACLTALTGAAAIAAVLIISKPESDKGIAADMEYSESVTVETPSGALKIIRNPKTITELAAHADAIVTGDIVEIERLEEKWEMQEGTPERAIAEKTAGNIVQTRTGTNYVIRVTEVLKGEPASQQITMYLSDDVKFLRPELQAGERYIFLLHWNDAIGRYVDLHPTAGYLKVDAKQRVEPVYKLTEDFKALDNQSYEIVKRKLQATSGD